MLYARFFPPETLPALAEAAISVDGWEIYVVSEELNDRPGVIGADQAVEIRENKGTPTLLIADAFSAGAGMDGIYSAAREITERDFYDTARRIALGKMGANRHVASYAVSQARRLGAALSPFRELEFYISAGAGPRQFGSSVGLLGIWPLALSDEPTQRDIDRAIKLTEYVLLNNRARVSAVSRVESLGLENPTQNQEQSLVNIIREADRRPFREITRELIDQEELWLGNIVPRVLDGVELLDIQLVPWRSSPGGKLAKWSGLQEVDGGRPTLTVDLSDNKKNTRMEIRWNVNPQDLPANSVDYVVEILSGDDVLATRRVPHVNKPVQKCVLTGDDFDIEEGSKFEAVVRVRSGDLESMGGEDFIVTTGNVQVAVQSRKVLRERTVVDGLSQMDHAAYQEVVAAFGEGAFYEKGKDAVSVRTPIGHSVVVSVPPLLRMVEDDWQARTESVGYWVVSTFDDGRLAGDLTFVPVDMASWDASTKSRLLQSTQQFLNRIHRGPGILAWVNHERLDASDYLNAWIQALDGGDPNLAKAFTVEVQDLSNHPVGLIVLPFHPLRVAWQVAYDELVEYSRYHDGLSHKEVYESLKSLDGSYFPMFLPHGNGDAWVFAGMLDFHAAAMVSSRDPEPKSSVARMAKAWFGALTELPSEEGTGQTLRREIRRFRELHPDYQGLHIHGVKVGDAGSVIAALGPEVSDPDSGTEPDMVRYELELYPSDPADNMIGAKIIEVMQKQQTRGAIPDNLRWMSDSLDVGGERLIPRFEWRRHRSLFPGDSAHLSVAFNIFQSEVRLVSKDIPATFYVLYGLIQPLYRHMEPGSEPVWYLTIPLAYDGRKHPMSSRLTERLTKLQFLITELTVKQMTEDVRENWPALVTYLDTGSRKLLDTLHRTSDWVVSFDRNIGFEYFDNPRDYEDVYDLYIIDCVPERSDLNSLQMVTSTIHIDEVLFLLRKMLDELDMSRSINNGRKVLDLLKTVSGRLAMRLSGQGTVAQEAVALALFLDRCRESRQDPWLSLIEGFFVPLDELPEFFGASSARSDFIYVTSPKRGILDFRFIEVKFRRYLETARSADLITEINHQLHESQKRWNDLFDVKKPVIGRMAIRYRAAQILGFYLDKAYRHYLSDEIYNKLLREIMAMARDPDYDVRVHGTSHRGYIFCPEYRGVHPRNLTSDYSVWLFGLESNEREERVDDESDRNEHLSVPEEFQVDVDTDPNIPAPLTDGGSINHSRPIILGHDIYGTPAEWHLSIRGNPHLLMVGLPGMGKTTALVNITRQMVRNGVYPIIFSYHEDIDEAAERLWGDKIKFIDFNAIGFNPLTVSGNNPFGYMDNAGTLRDIFSAIFPDLGDIQLASIRDAIRDVYQDYGWSNSRVGHIPPFRAFWELLRENPKADPKVLTRLRELDDYGVFEGGEQAHSLLDSAAPLVIRLHMTQNETVQRAFGMFILYRLYQDMFGRGVQNDITHAIVFDEAHRASKLKLLGRMAKECRKYGLSMLLASQEIKDFDESLVQAIGTYLILRVGEADSKVMARYMGSSDQVKATGDALKVLPKFESYFFTEGYGAPRRIKLANPFEP